MTGDGVNFDGTNQDGVTGYQIEYSTSTFTPGDGSATVYEFDAFPHTMTGLLQPSTTYYFTVRSICGDNYSEWEQNPDNNGDGPDAYTTTTCPSSYSLPYLNDFNDPVTWTSCQTFYDNDGDGYVDALNLLHQGPGLLITPGPLHVYPPTVPTPCQQWSPSHGLPALSPGT